ncbi:hypothetical protein LCGC14_1352880 [marine sediment metagenome]|uniref:Uncharacterized protein n=1 Tax=marine sediment metagenome TaxID=412755 RepID=A0A0F9NCM7_9ZZZZ
MKERLPNGQWKQKYLTIDMFDKFLHNAFWHLNLKVNISLWLMGIIIALMGITLGVVLVFVS